jgi:hypothetical protein
MIVSGVAAIHGLYIAFFATERSVREAC